MISFRKMSVNQERMWSQSKRVNAHQASRKIHIEQFAAYIF